MSGLEAFLTEDLKTKSWSQTWGSTDKLKSISGSLFIEELKGRVGSVEINEMKTA